MTSVRVEFDRREARDALAQVASAGREVRHRALTLAGEALVSEAQADSPVKTGFLQSSHVVQGGVDADGAAISLGAGSLDAELAAMRRPAFVEIGVNAEYGLAVHDRHPTRARWFVDAVSRHLPRILRIALPRAVAEAAARRGGGS